MLLSNFLHPWFLSDSKGQPQPETLFNTRQATIPFSLAWSLGRFGQFQAIKDTPLASNFLGDLDNIETISPETKQLLSDNYAFYLICMIASNSDNGLERVLSAPPVHYTQREQAKSIVREYCQNLYMFYKNDTVRPKILSDVKDFITRILYRENALFVLPVYTFWQGVSRTPSYLTKTLQKRLHLASFHQNYSTVAHRIQLIKTPHLYITPSKPGKCEIHPYVFDNLLEPPPHVFNMTPNLKRFHDMLWKTHLHDFPSMRKTQMEYSHRVLPFIQDGQKIFEQLLILMFDNWEELWAHRRHPRTLEVRRRIEYLKRIEKGHVLDTEEFIMVLLRK